MKKITTILLLLFLATAFAADKPIPQQNGGTGVNNAYTITVGGALNTASSFTTSGINPLTLTTSGTTNSTLPVGTTTLVPTVGTGATGTWGINISGNAATASSAGVATDANINLTSSNSNFPLLLSVSSSGAQPIYASSPLFANPSTGIIGATGLKLTGLTGLEAVVADSVGNLISFPYASANTASSLVERDSSGNFLAGTITAALTGNSSTASTLQTARAINGVNFDGSAPITVAAAAGTLTGTTLNSTVVTSSLTSVGTISSGTWSGLFGVISGANLTNLTAANISAGTAGINISGNAATATSSTTATNANNINTATSGSNTSFYLPFVASATSGYQALNINSNLNYNPLSGVLTLPNITLTAPSPSQLIGLNSGGNIAAIGAGTSTTILHGNASGLPTYSAVSLTADVTGILPNSNTNATSANTASAIVARDGSGNFTAGTITAALVGNASTATTAANLTGLTLRSVLFATAGGGVNQDNSNFVYDGAGHNLFLGTNSISPNGVGRLNLNGTDSTVGNSQVFYTGATVYPLLQFLPFAHDNVSLNFDAYYSGGWVSSSSNSSFHIAKTASAFNLEYGVATAGSALTWSTGLSLSSTGTVTIPQLTASNLVTTGAGGLLVSSNTLSTTVLGNIPKVTITVFAGGASGNYTPPAGCTSILVKGWGGGGGGGGVAGAAASAGGAGGGGSGGYFQTLLTAPFGGAPFAYTVGSGGAGGTAGANNGSVGGNTTFGSITAGHGAGGSGVTSGVSAAIGGGGNITASSGSADIITTGNGGSPGFALSASLAVGGNGAIAPAGGGGGRGGLTGTGGAGGVPGGGGAGGALTSNSNVAGGAGGDGKILIYEYYNG